MRVKGLKKCIMQLKQLSSNLQHFLIYSIFVFIEKDLN